ncbi:hypothetical protein DFP72DRAFT_848833 [Ephemerocybe angulata]|uniref:Uncharacterized protein n=1 Tax=Ephemerocybe angulata TaxID=980116 RepID=A0A8H6HVZ8_9AGAR|nr:hypothetical protein DFP72DRAFT_848833 [Tulosesus angulatus]
MDHIPLRTRPPSLHLPEAVDVTIPGPPGSDSPLHTTNHTTQPHQRIQPPPPTTNEIQPYLTTALILSLLLTLPIFWITGLQYFFASWSHDGTPACVTMTKKHPSSGASEFACNLMGAIPLLSIATFVFDIAALGMVGYWRFWKRDSICGRLGGTTIEEGNGAAGPESASQSLVNDANENRSDAIGPRQGTSDTAPLLPKRRKNLKAEMSYGWFIMAGLIAAKSLLWLIAVFDAVCNMYFIAVVGVPPWPGSTDPSMVRTWIRQWVLEGALHSVQVLLLGWAALTCARLSVKVHQS